MSETKVLILGVTGMLGHALFAGLSAREGFDVRGTARRLSPLQRFFGTESMQRVIPGVLVDDLDSVREAIELASPDVVINAIGMIKQRSAAEDPIISISINSLFPHRLAEVAGQYGARVIHFSTDCVFTGDKGSYTEDDVPDPTDLYGRSKLLGELYLPHCVTLRTSFIGHELRTRLSLIEWFLSQEGKVKGYTNAIYSGFPTVEIVDIISEYVIPAPELKGLYHVSSQPISKYKLLKLVAEKYKKQIEIEPDDDVRVDRSLDSSIFRSLTGYTPPPWPELVDRMYRDFISASYYNKKPGVTR